MASARSQYDVLIGKSSNKCDAVSPKVVTLTGGEHLARLSEASRILPSKSTISLIATSSGFSAPELDIATPDVDDGGVDRNDDDDSVDEDGVDDDGVDEDGVGKSDDVDRVDENGDEDGDGAGKNDDVASVDENGDEDGVDEIDGGGVEGWQPSAKTGLTC
jgi:hypothetical protein